MAVAVHRPFFEQLPALPEVDEAEAEIAWFIYDLNYNNTAERYKLERSETKYTKFKGALDTITTPDPGDIAHFVDYLKTRASTGKLTGTPPQSELPPDVKPLPDVFSEEITDEEGEHLLENSDA